MKRISAILCGAGLLAALAVFPVMAAPPDGDGDGWPKNQDCDDKNYYVNPGVAEVCDDGIDNNCDGQIDEGCGGGGGGDHGSLTWADYPSACIGCHNGGDGGHQYSEMMDSTHYKWVGAAPDMANQPEILQGKLTNAVNSYCINIMGDWPVCGSCHVGRGEEPGDELATFDSAEENIDCLMCHNADYALNRVRLPDGTMGPAAGTPQATLDGYVQNIGPPTRGACLKCHANAGGGNGVKRGDLSMALIDNADPNFDVHMNVAGPNLQCRECHTFQGHKTIGKGSDLRPTDDLSRGSEVSCSSSTCHTGMDSGTGHAASGRRAEPDRHVARVACQSCHIPTYAKWETEVHRDWRTHHDGGDASCDPGAGETPCPGHPHTEKAANQIPELKFWNRLSDNYLLGDIAVMDPETGAYPTSRPLGDIHDGKLTPFKYKTADQPMVSDNNLLIALDTLEYLKVSGDVELATLSGLANMDQAGYPVTVADAYEWVTTDTYQMINHGVNPVSDVADCSQCHGDGVLDVTSDSMLDVMGYRLKGVKEEVCNQCHDGSKKLPRTWDRMHSHLDKGSTGIGCRFCHDFDRTERALCDPCENGAPSACSTEYVDNVPYDHQCSTL